MPAMPPDESVTPVINKRRIRPKRFDDFQTSSLHVVKQHSLCNSRGYKNIQCSMESFRHSYFPKTISDSNLLEDSVLCAKSPGAFRSAIRQRDLPPFVLSLVADMP